MTAVSEPWDYALWLLPERGAAASLQARIAHLAAAHAAPVFAPHVTAYGGHGCVDRSLENRCRQLAAALAPFAASVPRLIHGDFLFQTLFLEMAKPPELALWFEQVIDLLGNPKGYRLQPHLSLLYAPLEDAAKQALARAEQAWFETAVPATLFFDRLALVTPGPVGWHQFDAWRTVLEAPLGVPSA